MGSSSTDELSFRLLEQNDGALVAELIEQSPDTGIINFAPHYRIDAIQSFKLDQGEYFGIVAQLSGKVKLAGVCLARVHQAQYNGSIRSNSYINSLVVHPAFRRKGIASELVRRIVDYSYEKLGKDCVIWAAIQDGNIGSERTIQKTLREKLQRKMMTLSYKPLTRPPRFIEDFKVRPIEEEDYPFVIEGMNQFYRSWNFYSPESVRSLSAWLNQTPFVDCFRHYHVVEDTSGQIVSGASISDDYRLREIHIEGMPIYLRILNALLRYVPSDGVLKNVVVSKFWYLPDCEEAATCLWAATRWDWRNKASSLLIFVDSHSPILEVINPRAWMPKTVLSLLISNVEPIDQDRLIYL